MLWQRSQQSSPNARTTSSKQPLRASHSQKRANAFYLCHSTRRAPFFLLYATPKFAAAATRSGDAQAKSTRVVVVVVTLLTRALLRSHLRFERKNLRQLIFLIGETMLACANRVSFRV